MGNDLGSARKLQDGLSTHFDDDHLLRVDHFMGNREDESLMISRFANTLLAPIWHRTYVDNVQITLAEDFDVADRGSFYDKGGLPARRGPEPHAADPGIVDDGSAECR
ncbi:hypothetical protein ADK87_05495 [Streptomyces sp. NRRL F-4711]|nr:hypothetical protein ADK87_05495 [Streptomyces sp. NRRL F-4711]